MLYMLYMLYMPYMPYMPKVPNMPLFVQRTGGQVGKGQEAG